MTKKELSEKLKICQGGTLTNALNALIASDFIEKYKPFACKDKSEYFRLKDPFCIFYIKFIEKNDSLDSNFWIDNVSSQNIVSWRGIAFENVCFNHIEQIKSALGILGVGTKQSAWVNKDDISGTQIDMIIDRKDNIVNMCEIKFYNGEFIVDKSYEKIIRDREKALRKEISLSKTIHSTLITSYGLRYNEHSGTFAKVICMDDLFRKI